MMKFKQFRVKPKTVNKPEDHRHIERNTAGLKATKPLNRKPFGDPQYGTQSAHTAENS